MNAPPFPLNPAIGERYLNWVWNGARWVCSPAAGTRVIMQTFGAPGTFTYQPSPGLVTAVVETTGAGGGGGGVSCDTALWLLSAPGGGSGSYSRSALDAALLLGGVVVTVGAGGLGGAPGGGTAGGATNFGALVGAAGGGAGGDTTVLGANVVFGAVGAGGAGVGEIGGQAVFHGSDGSLAQNAHYLTGTPPDHIRITGGRGGEMFGGSTTTVCGFNAVAPGLPGWDHTGAGGGGAALNLFIGSAAGGAGGSGVCIVTEYCWADGSEDDCGCGPIGVDARVAITSDQGWAPRGPRGPHGGFDGNE